MWIVPALIGFAVLGWLGYAWMNALFVKYEHTRESVASLILLAAVSLYSGWKTATAIAPGWSVGPRASIALGLGFTLFSVFSFIVVSLWTAILTRRFDESVAALDDEEESILRNLETMRWEAYHGTGDVQEKPSADDLRKVDPRVDLRKAVEVWEQGGGAARIRSLKVLEWREEMSTKSAQEIKDDIRLFELEISSEIEEPRKEQIRARMAVARLALLEKEPTRVEPAAVKTPEGVTKVEMKADEAVMRERLQEIHREIQAVKTAKAQYLRGKVKLGWRAGT